MIKNNILFIRMNLQTQSIYREEMTVSKILASGVGYGIISILLSYFVKISEINYLQFI